MCALKLHMCDTDCTNLSLMTIHHLLNLSSARKSLYGLRHGAFHIDHDQQSAHRIRVNLAIKLSSVHLVLFLSVQCLSVTPPVQSAVYEIADQYGARDRTIVQAS